MCGRFTRQYSWRDVHAFLDLQFPSAEDLGRSFNVAPTQPSPVCRAAERGERELAIMRWGFTPVWSKDGKPGPINARAETAATNGMFRSAYKSRRCLVPASGFYEWQKRDGGAKQPYLIRLLNDPIFCFAGLWESWRGDGDAVESFTVLTTEPNELMAPIHNRMPVIVRPSDFGGWLGGEAAPDDVLTPFPAEEMQAFPVSTRVNSPRNNDPSLVEPFEPGDPDGGEPSLFGPGE